MHSPGCGLSLDRSHFPRESASVLARFLLTFLLAASQCSPYLPEGAEDQWQLPTSSVVTTWIDQSPVSGDARDPRAAYVFRHDRRLGPGWRLPDARLILAFLGVLAAFFFVGPIAGIVLLIAAVILAIVLLVRWIKANELT